MNNIKTYSELVKLNTFEERFMYLKLDGAVGIDTFGFDRYLNQHFYKTKEWKRTRDIIILRDNGCDLGIDEELIFGKIIIHHINPISIDDIKLNKDYILDPEFLICTSLKTHNAIHYSDDSIIYNRKPIIRKPNDTIPWRN